MRAPDWFVKELKLIMPELYPLWNEEFGYWEIKVRRTFERTIGTEVNARGITVQTRVRAENPTVDVVQTLDQRCLAELRFRKYEGERTDRADPNRDVFLDELVERNRAAKAKKQQIAREMIAEGVTRMDKRDNHPSLFCDLAITRQRAS